MDRQASVDETSHAMRVARPPQIEIGVLGMVPRSSIYSTYESLRDGDQHAAAMVARMGLLRVASRSKPMEPSRSGSVVPRSLKLLHRHV